MSWQQTQHQAGSPGLPTYQPLLPGSSDAAPSEPTQPQTMGQGHQSRQSFEITAVPSSSPNHTTAEQARIPEYPPNGSPAPIAWAVATSPPSNSAASPQVSQPWPASQPSTSIRPSLYQNAQLQSHGQTAKPKATAKAQPAATLSPTTQQQPESLNSNLPRKRESSAFQPSPLQLPTPVPIQAIPSSQTQGPYTPHQGGGAALSSSHWAAAGGIDLRAEEEALRANEAQSGPTVSSMAPYASANSAAASLQRSAAQGHSPYLQLYPLAQIVYRTASQHGLCDVDPEVLNTLSAAARMRFRNLLEAMVKSTRHRCWSTHLREPPMRARDDEDDDVLNGDAAEQNLATGEGPSGRKRKKLTPMFRQDLISDPSKWLTAIERAERGQEALMRRRRAYLREMREKAAAAAAATAAGGGNTTAAGGIEGVNSPGAGDNAGADDIAMEGSDEHVQQTQRNKRPRKDASASMTAKNMSEDVRRRLANNTAARALGGIGGTMPKWMMMGGSAAASSASVKNLSGAKKEDSVDAMADDASLAGTSLALPKPRFAPGGSANGGPGGWAIGGSVSGLAPSGLSGSPLAGSAGDGDAGGVASPRGVDPQGWGDPALRALAREEEERQRRKRVNLDDALHALEMERRGNSGGRGSGQKVLYHWRMLRAGTASFGGGGLGEGSAGGGSGRGATGGASRR